MRFSMKLYFTVILLTLRLLNTERSGFKLNSISVLQARQMEKDEYNKTLQATLDGIGGPGR